VDSKLQRLTVFYW